MIKARAGLCVAYRFRSEHVDLHPARKAWVGGQQIDLAAGEHIESTTPIEAWSDDGEPMVVGRKGLVSAASFSNFVGVTESHSDGDIVQIMPASDWRIWRVDETGLLWSNRLAAWGLKPSGDMVPLESDGSGCVMPPDEPYLIRHESEGPPNQEWVTANTPKGPDAP